jgi:hypothetical protein
MLAQHRPEVTDARLLGLLDFAGGTLKMIAIYGSFPYAGTRASY